MREWSEDMDEPIPARLSEAIDPLMADFQQPHAIPTIGFEPLGQTL